MINRVTLVGRLGADPEIRTLANGTMVARLRMATTENYRDRAGQWQEETQWHDVVVWRHLAERAQKYCRKGSLVYLEGKLTHRKWEDKDGNSRKSTEVVGAMFRLLDGKREQDTGQDGSVDTPPMAAEEDLPF
ncbi:Single-stranded DNA-binding protein [Neolewinella maritima]|uniref:Single-stranded DNA-binding protein n=1 Tax=Neolewinella maritima TaxID=1383882 RepID=A0ABM9B0R9_9BACT|nr:single-stranded DNA-binding protein [Neolewinella maritima]CAH1000657.1 Single-stranded DNA-binding protein [Neolewinella maritima]